VTDVFAVDGVDDLFGGDLSDFVARRDALSKQLKKDGDKDAAAALKALRKPSTVAWAVNQVARQRTDDIDALLAAGAAVRDAQVKAVRGQGDGGLRTTTAQWRTHIHGLADAVARAIGEQYRDDAAATFQAASGDDELAALLRAGRLMAVASPSGFGLAGMPDPPERAERDRVATPAPIAADDDADIHDERVEPARDEHAVAHAREQLDRCETALEKATMKLRRAEQRLDVARKAVEEANVARDLAIGARDDAATALRDAEGGA